MANDTKPALEVISEWMGEAFNEYDQLQALMLVAKLERYGYVILNRSTLERLTNGP